MKFNEAWLGAVHLSSVAAQFDFNVAQLQWKLDFIDEQLPMKAVFAEVQWSTAFLNLVWTWL